MSASTAQATAFDVLRTPNFARLWAAQVISSFGDKVSYFALAYVSWQATSSALVTTLAFATSISPHAIFGFFGGAVADAVGHRRAMVACDVIRAALIGTIPVLLAVGAPLPTVYVLVFVAALCAAVFNPARLAVVPDLVPADQLGASNSMVNASDRTVEIGGSVVAGLIVAALGAFAFYVDAATFIVSAVLLLQITRQEPAPRAISWRRLLSDALDGIRWIGDNAILRNNTILSLVAQLSIPVLNALTPVLVFREYRLGPEELGWAEAALAVGAVATGLLLPTIFARRRKGVLVIAGFAAWGAALIGIGIAPTFLVALVLFAIAGVTNVLFFVSNITISQEVTPSAFRARVFGARMALLNLSWLPIVLGVGALADLTSASLLVAIAGAVTLATAFVGALIPSIRDVP
ncbi:MAG: MFS transporter [Chloroflexota bacterium]|nr:MFS transporter [Chloroflexota bacterium]MDE3192497.1 MFS transporter [Chloroflexota bacterium]